MAIQDIKSQVEALYIGYFGRAGEPDGVNYWVTQLNSGHYSWAEAAASFSVQPEAIAMYPFLKFPAIENPSTFVDQIYMNLFNREPDPEGKAYWVQQLLGRGDDPQAIGQFILDVINGAFGPSGSAADAAAITNKVVAATYFTEQLAAENIGGTHVDANGNVVLDANLVDPSKAAVSGVTSDAATIDASKAATDDFIAGLETNPGQTFVLTTEVDNIQGTSGDDLIIAGEGSAFGDHTLGSSDVINGGAGFDTIDIVMTGHTTLVPHMTNVEKMLVQSLGNNSQINMINATGVEQIWSNNSTNNLRVTNLQEKAEIGVKGGNGSHFAVQAAPGALTGDLAISLDKANVGSLFVNSTGSAGDVGYKSATINAVGGKNAINGVAGVDTSHIQTLDVGAALETVKVTGDGAVRVVDNLAATVRTIDASANTGGVNLNITNNTGNVTFTGGQGNDRINFGETLTIQDKVDGGAGRDTLAVTNQSYIVPGLQVTNIEVLALRDLTGTLEAGRIAGIDEVRVDQLLTDGTVNGLTSDSTFVTNAAGTVTINLKDAQVAGTHDTLNLKTGIANNGTVNVSAPGVETVAYTQNNAANAGANTTVNFSDVDGVIDMTSLSIASNAGNTVNFNGLVNTIKTVDASAAKGAVNVSIATGNATNGVSITGGSGNDRLTGGDGKDVIIGGAGNDRIQGDAVSATEATKQVSKVTFTDQQVGDVVSITYKGVTYSQTLAANKTAAGLAGDLGLYLFGGATLASVLAADGVTTSASGGVLTLTSGVAGTAAGFAVSASVLNDNGSVAVPSHYVFTVTGAGTGDTIDMFVNGNLYKATLTITAGDITGVTWDPGLLPALNATGVTFTATTVSFDNAAGNVITSATSATVSGGTLVSAVITNGTPAVSPTTDTFAVDTTSAMDVGSIVNAASDILTGGEGNDTFAFIGQSGGWNGTKLVNMDTITDLDLGGATAGFGADHIVLNAAFFGGPFNATSLVNAGTPVAMTGPTFEAALQGLYNAGGALSGATDKVGLFTYGADTYLIAADQNVGLGANDIIIKVTGVKGTLDLSDITLA